MGVIEEKQEEMVTLGERRDAIEDQVKKENDNIVGLKEQLTSEKNIVVLYESKIQDFSEANKDSLDQREKLI